MDMTTFEHITAVVGGIVILASAIVKWTPTPKDDAFLSKIMPILEFVSMAKK